MGFVLDVRPGCVQSTTFSGDAPRLMLGAVFVSFWQPT